MERKLEKAQKFLLEEIKKESIIDATEENIGGVSLKDLQNLDFGDNIEEELVLVRVTDFYPYDGEIKSARKADVMDSQNIFEHRNTVHFTLNHKVVSHVYGDFNGRKYIIIQPFKDVRDKILGFSAVDTYFEGGLHLTDSAVILMKQEEYENVELPKIKAKVIPYIGDSDIAVQKCLIMMGYKPQLAGKDTFWNERNSKEVDLKYRLEKGYDSGKHSYSIYCRYEECAFLRDKILTDLRGQLVDTRYENLEISIDELQQMLIERKIDTTSKEKIYEFFVQFGIIPKEESYEILADEEAMKRYQACSIGNALPFVKEDEKMSEEVYQRYQKDIEALKIQKEQQVKEKKIEELFSLSLEEFNSINSKEKEEILRKIRKEMNVEKIGYKFVVNTEKTRLLVEPDNDEMYDEMDKKIVQEGFSHCQYNKLGDFYDTDFNWRIEGENMAELFERMEAYASLFSRAYQGENVEFNEYGEIIEEIGQDCFAKFYEEGKEYIPQVMENIKNEKYQEMGKGREKVD